MQSQHRITLSFGSGDEGIARAKKWGRAYKQADYEGLNPMIRDMVDWILDKAIWKRGVGVVGLQKVAAKPEAEKEAAA